MPGLPANHRFFARASLSHYGFDGSATLRLLSLSENATYLVDDGERSLVLRVHRPGYHSVESILSERCWMAALGADTPVATPVPMTATDGAEVVCVDVGGHVLVVDAVSLVPGCTAEEASGVVDFAAVGAATAHLHDHASAWLRPPGFVRFTWDTETILGPRARWGDWRAAPNLSPDDRDAIAQAAAVVTRRLDDYGTTPDRFGLIHADLRLANLMLDPAAADPTLTVIDFDDCGFSWYMADLGGALSWIEEEPGVEGLVADWLRGYLGVRPLAEEHLLMIPTFVLLRRIHLTAWLASHADADAAIAIGPDYVPGTARLARRYLDDPSWLRAHTSVSVA